MFDFLNCPRTSRIFKYYIVVAGPDQDRAAEQGHQEREDPGDADVPGQQWHVQDTQQLPRGLPGT